LPAERPGGDVRVTEVRDEHRHPSMIRFRTAAFTRPSDKRQNARDPDAARTRPSAGRVLADGGQPLVSETGSA
jgi:hypothetical protein